MWYQLGLFGSRVVEAVSVGSEDKGAVASTVTVTSNVVVPVESQSARMEGNDVTALIAARMGIDPSEVTAKLVSLHHKKELDGAAGPPPVGAAGPPPVEDEESDVSLTLGALEEFERSKAAAAAAIAPATPVQLKMKPAVLGAPPPTPTTSKSLTPAAVTQAEMEVEDVALDRTEPPSSALKWCEDDEEVVAMEPEEDRAYGEHESKLAAAREQESKLTAARDTAAREPEEDRAYGEHEVWPEPRRRYDEAVEA
jgi:hypothetical protein